MRTELTKWISPSCSFPLSRCALCIYYIEEYDYRILKDNLSMECYNKITDKLKLLRFCKVSFLSNFCVSRFICLFFLIISLNTFIYKSLTALVALTNTRINQWNRRNLHKNLFKRKIGYKNGEYD